MQVEKFTLHYQLYKDKLLCPLRGQGTSSPALMQDTFFKSSCIHSWTIYCRCIGIGRGGGGSRGDRPRIHWWGRNLVLPPPPTLNEIMPNIALNRMKLLQSLPNISQLCIQDTLNRQKISKGKGHPFLLDTSPKTLITNIHFTPPPHTHFQRASYAYEVDRLPALSNPTHLTTINTHITCV